VKLTRKNAGCGVDCGLKSHKNMPEGPSIVILKEEARPFAGKKIIAVSGNSKTDLERLLDQKVLAFKSWGKHFLICFNGFTVRIHFLLFGSYRVNDKKGVPERLSLVFKNGELNFYSCSVKFIEGDLNAHYDWSVDVMNDAWSPRKALKSLRSKPGALVCDALLEQDIFAGVGNIIKNEVLYRVKVHPASAVGKIPAGKLREIVKQARVYSFDFLAWKKQYVLRKHWLAHAKKTCLRCQLPIIKKYMGVKNRRTFFCQGCQVLYGELPEMRNTKFIGGPKAKAQLSKVAQGPDQKRRKLQKPTINPVIVKVKKDGKATKTKSRK
jgi:endonuclease VIII